MVQIVYDAIAVELTEMLFAGLRERGFDDFVSQALEELADAEQFTLSRLQEIEEASQGGNPLMGLESFSKEQSFLTSIVNLNSYGLSPMGAGEYLSLLHSLRNRDPGQWDPVFREWPKIILDNLAPNGLYHPQVPYNIVEAINALYHITVAPIRCFAYASDVFDRRRVQFEIVDSRGRVVYGKKQQAALKAGERAFWELIDEVDSVWRLKAYIKSVANLQGQSSTSTLAQQRSRRVTVPREYTSLTDHLAVVAYRIQCIFDARVHGQAA